MYTSDKKSSSRAELAETREDVVVLKNKPLSVAARPLFTPRLADTVTCRTKRRRRRRHEFMYQIIDHIVDSVICEKATVCPFKTPRNEPRGHNKSFNI